MSNTKKCVRCGDIVNPWRRPFTIKPVRYVLAHDSFGRAREFNLCVCCMKKLDIFLQSRDHVKGG